MTLHELLLNFTDPDTNSQAHGKFFTRWLKMLKTRLCRGERALSRPFVSGSALERIRLVSRRKLSSLFWMQTKLKRLLTPEAFSLEGAEPDGQGGFTFIEPLPVVLMRLNLDLRCRSHNCRPARRFPVPTYSGSCRRPCRCPSWLK